MKRTIVFVAMMATTMMGCGDAVNGQFDHDVSLIEVSINKNPIDVGDAAQLAVRVMMGDGTEFQGLTTSFTDPETGDVYPIEWYVSDEERARIDSEARLIPRTEGYVTIGAKLIDAEHSRVIKIDDSYGIYGLPPAPSENVEEGEGDEGEDQSGDSPELPVDSQGYAEDVFSFLPGDGAGFGGNDFPDIVLGPPEGAGSDGGSYDVLSLGRLGEIVLGLGNRRVVDGPGADFIVFENSFFVGGDPTIPFAELGVVGISDDGVNFVEFPCDDSGYPYTGCAGWNPVYSSSSNNISPFDVANAGGDAFDLATIGATSARYIRIRDVSDYGAAPSAGFDLDAIAIVNGEQI